MATRVPSDSDLASIGPGELSSRQSALVRAVVGGDPDLLLRPRARDGRSGELQPSVLELEEVARFAAAWTARPLSCTRMVNQVIGMVSDPARLLRYLEAAVDLEVLMDRWTGWFQRDRVLRGIPRYLPDGFTDLGPTGSPLERSEREKFRVDKERLKTRLVEARHRAVAWRSAALELLLGFHQSVRRTLTAEEARVARLSREGGTPSPRPWPLGEAGVEVSRCLAIAFQLCLQEAGIAGRLVKGTLCFGGVEGPHAWNLAAVGDRAALVDVTLPDVDVPFILVASSPGELYRLAEGQDRLYTAAPDRQNFFEIGAELTATSPAPAAQPA